MDTVDLVLITLAVLLLSTIGAALLAYREHCRAEAAQRELVQLVRAQRRAAGYDTGLVEAPIVQVPESA
jgi:hypothetical protein